MRFGQIVLVLALSLAVVAGLTAGVWAMTHQAPDVVKASCCPGDCCYPGSPCCTGACCAAGADCCDAGAPCCGNCCAAGASCCATGEACCAK